MEFAPTIPGMIRVCTGILWLGLGIGLLRVKDSMWRGLAGFFMAWGAAVVLSNASTMVPSGEARGAGAFAGIVGGVAAIAASPAQRAFERLGHATPDRSSVSRATADAAELAFRNAVTLAYKDRRFTAKEELALADLAEHLGVGARRTIEIRQEIERARGGR